MYYNIATVEWKQTSQNCQLHRFRWSVAFLRGTVAAWVRCKGGWDKLLSGRASHQQVFKKFFLQSMKFLSGVAAGGIVSPGLLVPGCVQEVQMIDNSNDLLKISAGEIFWVNHNFCIFTDLISIAVNHHYRARYEKRVWLLPLLEPDGPLAPRSLPLLLLNYALNNDGCSISFIHSKLPPWT